MMDPHSDAKIVASWRRNAQPWTVAVREQQIESRRLVTDAAIVDAVLGRAPQSVLDVGCGEGWLLRAVAPTVPHCVGTDVVPELIAAAKAAGGAEFHVAAYEQMAHALTGRFDVVVCNFALIGERSVDALFSAVPRLLDAGGAFIVQTVYPRVACGDAPYVDGWRDGSWAGFSEAFDDPAPWYFRTIESWTNLFAVHGLCVVEQREPLHPQHGHPASVIFIAEASRAQQV